MPQERVVHGQEVRQDRSGKGVVLLRLRRTIEHQDDPIPIPMKEDDEWGQCGCEGDLSLADLPRVEGLSEF